jgi:outer membrane protein assembly factor BamB
MVATAAWGQYPPIWTNAVAPGQETLDRLNLRLGWQAGIPVDGMRDGIATIQHLGDAIIVQTRHGAISALDPITGAARWRVAVGLPYPVNYRVGYSDTLILVANGTRIFALDRATGTELWDVDLAATPSSPPAADAESFYVCLGNGRLSAYRFPVETAPARPGAPTNVSPGAGRAQEPVRPLTSGVAAASGSGAVRTPPVPARPSAAGIGPPAELSRGGSTTGRTVTTSVGTSTRSASTAIQATGGRTAVGGGDINRTGHGPAATGGPQLRWDHQTNLRIAERPIIGEKRLFVAGTGREALFIDKTGEKPVVVTADAAFSAPLGQYGEVAYAGCANGTVYAFDLPTRSTLWQTTVDGAVFQRPIATDEDLYISSERGGLARFARANGTMVWHNPAAVRFVASNPKFVYARDALGRLLVLDRGHGTLLTNLDVREFTTNLMNRETDRIVLAADNGLVISLHDKAYPQPLRLYNPPPPPPPPAAEVRPEPPAAPPPPRPRPAPAPSTPPAASEPTPETPPAPRAPAPKAPPRPMPPTTPPKPPPTTPPVTPPPGPP